MSGSFWSSQGNSDAGVDGVFHSSSRDWWMRSTAMLTVPNFRRISSVARSERSRTRVAILGSRGFPEMNCSMTACTSASRSVGSSSTSMVMMSEMVLIGFSLRDAQKDVFEVDLFFREHLQSKARGD